MVALAVNSWFLLPDLIHASQTRIGGLPLIPWSASGPFSTPAMLFNPLRAVPIQSTTPGLYVQAPVWFLIWAVIAGVSAWSVAGRRLHRVSAALIALLVALLVVIMVGRIWDALPRTLREVQVPYRLNTYVALAIAALVLVGALARQRLESGRRRTTLGGLLAGAIAVSVGL